MRLGFTTSISQAAIEPPPDFPAKAKMATRVRIKKRLAAANLFVFIPVNQVLHFSTEFLFDHVHQCRCADFLQGVGNANRGFIDGHHTSHVDRGSDNNQVNI